MTITSPYVASKQDFGRGDYVYADAAMTRFFVFHATDARDFFLIDAEKQNDGKPLHRVYLKDLPKTFTVCGEWDSIDI